MQKIEELYRVQAARLMGYLVANGMGEADAADIVQEAFLRLWKHRSELLDDPAQLSGLLWTTARNLRTDRFRKSSHETLQGEVGEYEGGILEPPTLPSDTAYLRQRLAAAFAELPPLLREAYTMFQILDLSVREIALRTGTTESNVKVRIFRAKERLRPLLADLMQSEESQPSKKI